MNRTARVALVLPALVGLGWLSVHSLASGAAGSTVFNAGVSMRSWSSSRAPQPANEALGGIREALVQAESTTPRDPAIHELLGLIDARRGERREYLPQAAVEFAAFSFNADRADCRRD